MCQKRGKDSRGPCSLSQVSPTLPPSLDLSLPRSLSLSLSLSLPLILPTHECLSDEARALIYRALSENPVHVATVRNYAKFLDSVITVILSATFE